MCLYCITKSCVCLFAGVLHEAKLLVVEARRVFLPIIFRDLLYQLTDLPSSHLADMPSNETRRLTRPPVSHHDTESMF